VKLFALEGLGEITAKDDLPTVLAHVCVDAAVRPGDIICVAHKIVSKAEGRMVALDDVRPGTDASELARTVNKDPRLLELILRESRKIVRRRGSLLVCETHHGFICANAGIDASNVPDGHVVLLPVDPDRSARHIQGAIARAVGGRVGVVITDTHGRAFRRAIINVAIGVAGFAAVVDHRGGRDREGRVLVATEQALGDEVAAAAGMLMDKGGGHPVVVVRGVSTSPAPGTAADLVRDESHDVFRQPTGEPVG
jgi:coenzyme F420-0:L-glutamate ligase/coenzyme F420-1:gamma-L-glutamate ligase